ncbi:MAG TPA: beta-ketoacyl synthase chain length factor [Oligoflexia bacterium]|nr:beta-ketoacyl synthase chain length factor [Oligoflexia bacterium]
MSDFILQNIELQKFSAWSPFCTEHKQWIDWALDDTGTALHPWGHNHDSRFIDFESPKTEDTNHLASTPSVSFLPIGMRKKLSPLNKVSLYLMNECLHDDEDQSRIRIIMSSRFGEEMHTLELLYAIAFEEPSSPMAFSRSVHNSSIGMFSISSGNTQPATAIAAMDQSFGAGLIEALIQLYGNSNATRVLYLYSDEAIPPEFKPYISKPPCPYGAAFILKKCSSPPDLSSAFKNLKDISCLDFLGTYIRSANSYR